MKIVEEEPELGNNLLKDRKIALPEPVIPCIESILELDVPIINYGSFISTKVLGSTLQLTNKTKQEQIFQLNIDTDNVEYTESTKKMFDPYYEEDLPFRGTEASPVINSENKYNCWFIEDPIKKSLEKSVTLILPPAESLELIVVVKAPMTNSLNMLSFINISHVTEDVEAKKQTYVEKRIGKNNKVTSKRVEVSRSMKVMILGKLENPTLKCVKAIAQQVSG